MSSEDGRAQAPRGALVMGAVVVGAGVGLLAWAKLERNVYLRKGVTAEMVREVPRARVNINTASEEELSMLPGIGPGLAARIVQHREAHGAFGSVEELDDVWGIGRSLMERVREYAAVEEGQ